MNIVPTAHNLAECSRALLFPHHACLRPEKTTRAHDFPARAFEITTYRLSEHISDIGYMHDLL